MTPGGSLLVGAAAVLLALPTAASAAAPPVANASLTVDFAWPAIAGGVRSRTLQCPGTQPVGSAQAGLCTQLATAERDVLLPTPHSGCLLADLEQRSAHVHGILDGVAVDVSLHGCDEPAIGEWFRALGAYAPRLVRPRFAWCPGSPIDRGAPPLALAPVVVTPGWPRQRVSAARVTAATLAGMDGSLLRRARLFAAGRLARYTRADHVLLVDAPPSLPMRLPGPAGSLRADRAEIRALRSGWEQDVFRGALRDRLCASANGPVVGRAAIQRGHLVRSRGDLAVGDIAYGQVFDAELPDLVEARLLAQLQAAGLEPTTVRVYEPLQAAPFVIATARDPRAFAASLRRTLASLQGQHPDFELYEGMMLVVRDPSGSIMHVGFLASRAGSGGGGERPDMPLSQAGALGAALFYVPVGTRRFEELPGTIREPGTAHRVDRIRWLQVGGPRSATWRASGRYRACPRCRAQGVRLRAITRPAGCGVRALVGIVVRDRAGRVRAIRGVGAAPDCLAPARPRA